MAAITKNQILITEIEGSDVPVPWCDEFERMISGMNFAASNSLEMRGFKLTVMKHLQRFNNGTIHPDDSLECLTTRRMAVAKEVFGKLGQGVNVEPGLFVCWGCNVFIGDNVYINRGVSIYDNTLVKIGNGTLIGPKVAICTGTHPVDIRSREEVSGISYAKPIIIKADCWIGARAVILPDVRLRRGTTVGAGAVVTKDVEPESLVGGVPAKLIKKLN